MGYLDSMVSYEQWLEMEEEAKQLHHLVETQRSKINELVKLILPEGQYPQESLANYHFFSRSKFSGRTTTYYYQSST